MVSTNRFTFQDYGPKVNFKHKKVKTDTFTGKSRTYLYPTLHYYNILSRNAGVCRYAAEQDERLLRREVSICPHQCHVYRTCLVCIIIDRSFSRSVQFLFRLGNYQPFEMCNLEYDESKKSAIEMHQDDMWIWGNRLIRSVI